MKIKDITISIFAIIGFVTILSSSYGEKFQYIKQIIKYRLNTHKMKNNKMKNIMTIVIIIIIMIGCGLMMWESRNGFPPN